MILSSLLTNICNDFDKTPEDEVAAYFYLFHLARAIFYQYCPDYSTWKDYSSKLEDGIINDWNLEIFETLELMEFASFRTKTNEMVLLIEALLSMICLILITQ